ncbi:MAG: hypothetical protein ACM3PY_03075, partial [Omnitrophica WOR_2 bacterium]
MSELIPYSPITHAHLKPVFHPELQAEINSRTTVKYLRFLRPVSIDRLELPLSVYGRWAPYVPVHPAHLIVSSLNPSTYAWEVIKEEDLKPDPRITFEGLSQEMSEAEMNAHFQRVLAGHPPHLIELQGIQADILKVECDREHPVWPNHGENYGGPYQVPFGILDPLQVYGEALSPERRIPEIVPILRRGRIEPEASNEVTWRQWGESIVYESQYLSVGFALRRPLLLHLGWDALGSDLARNNRVSYRRVRFEDANRGVSGPLLVTPYADYGSHHWTGEVEIQGNRVSYRDLHCVPGFTMDATFHVETDHLVLEITQRADREIPAMEFESWRWVWDLMRGMTGVAAKPTLRSGRSGDIQAPFLFAGDNVGCLQCRVLDG